MSQVEQAILARDTIDYIRENVDNVDALEYLASAMFSLARILESSATISWDDIAGVCDQRYYSLRNGDPIELNSELLDPIYKRCEELIKNARPQEGLLRYS